MDKWTTLEPVKLHSRTGSVASKTTTSKPVLSGASHAYQNRAQYIGRLPSELHLAVLHFVAIPDFPSYARCSRSLAALACDERVWRRRWAILAGTGPDNESKSKAEAKIDTVLDELRKRGTPSASRGPRDRTSTGSMDLGALNSPNSAGRGPNGVPVYHTPNAPAIQEDDFGDFATANIGDDEFDDFVGAAPPPMKPKGPGQLFSPTFPSYSFTQATTRTFVFGPNSASRSQFAKAYSLLRPLLRHVHPSTPPHTLLSFLLPTPPLPPQATPGTEKIKEPTLQLQAQLLSILTRLLSPTFRPTSDWQVRAHALRSCIDVFEASLLKLFEDADTKRDQRAMREAAWAAWEIHTAWGVPPRKEIVGHALDVGSGLSGKSRLGVGQRSSKEWEVGKVWIERREEFYAQESWDPAENFTHSLSLSFDAMDTFINYILGSIKNAASTSNAVFPPPTCVLLLFSERLGSEIIAEYINGLLSRAQEVDAEKLNKKQIRRESEDSSTKPEEPEEKEVERFLQATAASFVVCWKIVDVLVEESMETVLRTEAESIIFRIFDPHMDEYLDEEVESVKRSFDSICREWDRKMSDISGHFVGSPTRTRFLTSQNPQLVKRNVVAGFTDVLMLPVTIIPRAVGAVGTVAIGAGSLAVGAAKTTGRLALGAAATTGTLAAGAARTGLSGISMLNPSKWGAESNNAAVVEGYVTPLNGDSESSYMNAKGGYQTTAWIEEQDNDWADEGKRSAAPAETDFRLSIDSKASSASKDNQPTSTAAALPPLDLFLSLDVALELIHAARDSMKRLESFFPPPANPRGHAPPPTTDETNHVSRSVTGFPGPSGRKLRETLEEIFILLLITLRERHLDPGFERAIVQMQHYKPSAPGSTDPETGLRTTSAVAPLLGFFELVHIGDTIGSMIQVYFDREMASYIDTTDFLSGIMREKKRFENALDEEVAKGLNTGTEVLMNQVEHILITRTTGREYCPPDGTVLAELGPTWACKEVIECLEMHCRVMRGSTSREVLEVFYTEVGMRLNA